MTPKARLVCLGLWLGMGIGGAASGKLIVGAEVHPSNFFAIPKGTGLETNANFGVGALFAGFSASDTFDLQAYLSRDNTGSFKGQGTIYGSTGIFDGKFNVLSYGVEIRISPPAIPIYFRGGVGLCDLTSSVTYTVAGVTAADPFGGFEGAFEAHGGLGISFRLAILRIHLGIDAVFVKIKENASSTLANVSGLLYFRPLAGATLVL
jgi:hypothetical protein